MRKQKVSNNPTAEPFPAAPEGLSERSQQLWKAEGPRLARTAGRREWFRIALEALDLAATAKEEYQRAGLIETSSKGKMAHLHPCVRLEADALTRFERLARRIGLHLPPPLAGAWRVGFPAATTRSAVSSTCSSNSKEEG
jgi:phage terminase small subunit